VVPTVGNNDNKYHDLATKDEDKESFYAFLYGKWITEMAGNKKLRDLEVPENKKIYDTFMEGAYYRVDITDKVSILALNTMYFMFGEDHPEENKILSETGT